MGGVKTDINRPIFPTSGGTPEMRRLLSSVNEVVTALLTSGALLGRIPPGQIMRPANGQIQLSWGTQNRVDVGVATGLASLPAIRPELIGAPLYVSKLSPSGVLNIKPTGKGSDGKTPALLDRSATGIRLTAAGLTVLMTDGENWHSSSERETPDSSLKVHTISSTGLNLSSIYANGYLRFTTGCTITVDSGTFNQGNFVLFRQVGTGMLSFTGTAAITPPVTKVNTTAQQGATIALVFPTSGTADAMGDLSDA